MVRLLVLRPEPGARATVARAQEMGLAAVSVPLFAVEPVEWEAPDPGGFDGLLVTSANALRCAGQRLQDLRGLTAYAVGDATAAAAREAGFDIAATGEAGVERLLGSIEADLRLLHLCGEHRRAPQNVRQKIVALTVYRANEIDRPAIDAAAGGVALIHSPRAARRLAELVGDRGRLAIAAISAAAADAASDGWKSIDVADKPTDEALLALAARLCKNSSPK